MTQAQPTQSTVPLTEAERVMLHALCEAVLISRMERFEQTEADPTGHGRCHGVILPPRTPEEAEMEARFEHLQATVRARMAEAAR